MITPKSDHQIDLECIEFVVTSVYKLVETSLHATPYSISVFHDLALMSDVIVSNRMVEELQDVSDKVYTRDLIGSD